MNTKELLQQFPEESFSELWNEQIKFIRQRYTNIDDSQIDNIETEFKTVFHLGNILRDIKNYLESNNVILSEDDTELIITWINFYNSIISKFKNPNNINLQENNISWIFRNFLNVLKAEELSREKIQTNYWNGLQWITIIEKKIKELQLILRLIKIESTKNGQISQKEIFEVKKIIESAKKFNEKYPEIEQKAQSLMNFEKLETITSIEKIWDFYKTESIEIQWKNWFLKNYWITYALLSWIIIIWISFWNIFSKHNSTAIIASIPSIAVLSIFLIFFLRQYSNDKSLIRAYKFKWLSAEFMEKLLSTRENTEEWKIIIEKSLDKILENPLNNGKGTNETINLVNTSVKTPTSAQ